MWLQLRLGWLTNWREPLTLLIYQIPPSVHSCLFTSSRLCVSGSVHPPFNVFIQRRKRREEQGRRGGGSLLSLVLWLHAQAFEWPQCVSSHSNCVSLSPHRQRLILYILFVSLHYTDFHTSDICVTKFLEKTRLNRVDPSLWQLKLCLWASAAFKWVKAHKY